MLHLDDVALSEELQERFKESTTKSALLSITGTVPKAIHVRGALKIAVSTLAALVDNRASSAASMPLPSSVDA